MTIPTESIVAGPFIGNGVASEFSFAFKVFADSDVLVKHTTVAGLDTTSVLNTNYIVVRNIDQDGSPGGSVIWKVSGLTTPLPLNEKITISSKVPNTQGTVLPQGGSWAAKTVERMIDKVTILVKQFGRDVTRSLRQPVTDAVLFTELPNAAARRGKFLFFADTVDALPNVAVGVDTSVVPVSAFMQTMLDDADAATARATIGAIGGTVTAFMQTVLDDADAATARVTLAIVTGNAPVDPGAAAAVGTGVQAARDDHKHRYQLEPFVIPCSDLVTDLTAGVTKGYFRTPYAFTVTDVKASLLVAQTAGALLTVDVNEAGVSILGTKLTFDNTEKTTVTAATQRTLTDTSLAADAEITVDIDVVGTAGARGLEVTIIGRQAT